MRGIIAMLHGRLLVTALAAAAVAVAGCESRETNRAANAVSRDGVGLNSQRSNGGDPSAIAEGARLYRLFNCNGCHFAGGGGIGPSLVDDEWLYGSEPEDILATILEGRPKGMPPYRGVVSEDDARKIVAYVRSLSHGEAVDR